MRQKYSPSWPSTATIFLRQHLHYWSWCIFVHRMYSWHIPCARRAHPRASTCNHSSNCVNLHVGVFHHDHHFAVTGYRYARPAQAWTLKGLLAEGDVKCDEHADPHLCNQSRKSSDMREARLSLKPLRSRQVIFVHIGINILNLD